MEMREKITEGNATQARPNSTELGQSEKKGAKFQTKRPRGLKTQRCQFTEDPQQEMRQSEHH